MWDKYPELKEDLEGVLQLMDKNIKCKDKRIENSIKELIYSGGKLLRPAFSLISSRFGQYNEEKSRSVAAAIEMLHMATLVHDDVIDDAKTRRGQETLQSKYGKDYAVYIGDYLFCICFRILATTSSIDRGIDVDTKVMSKICLGEINQLNSIFNKNLSIKEYFRIIAGKTAELFSLSFYIGAAESGCDKKICRLFWSIGHNIGMSFQIIDDILDYTGSGEQLGKSVGNDLKEGLYTLPLLLAIQNNPIKFEELLKDDEYDEDEIKQIVDAVKDNGGIKEAIKISEKYTKKAFRDINKLPDNEYKQILLEVVERLLVREY